MVLAINIYVMSVMYKKKELHELDFFLVTYQSGMDLVFTGVLGIIDYFLDIWFSLFNFCHYAGFFEWKKEYVP